MKIRTQLIITGLIIVISVALLLLALMGFERQAQANHKRNVFLDTAVNEIFFLYLQTSDENFDPESFEWQESFQKFNSTDFDEVFSDTKYDLVSQEITKTKNILKSVFRQVSQVQNSFIKTQLNNQMVNETQKMLSLSLELQTEISKDLLEKQQQTEKIILLISIILLSELLMGASLLYKRIVTPLKILTESSIMLSDSNFDINLPQSLLKSKNELGILSQSFDGMSKRLKTSYFNLENEVAKRTLTLQETNNELKRFEQAVNYATDGVIFTNVNGNIIYVNQKWQKLSGYTDTEVLGKNPNILKSSRTPASVYEAMWKALRKGESFFTDEIINVKKDGTEFEIELTVFPILGKDNNPDFFVGLQQDISEKRELDRIKSDFIGLASHQLRTPLTGIKWNAEMLMSGDVGELSQEQKDLVDQLSQSTNRLVKLVNNLLNATKIESGKITISEEKSNIQDIAQACIEELQPLIEKKQLTIQLAHNQNNPEPFYFDPDNIKNVISNLLSNAVIYSPDNTTINAAIEVHDNESVHFWVKDQGMGIPEEDTNTIFQKFQRGTNAIKSDTEGTGLGLFLVKKIVDASGGSIWFESRENKGTTFWFKLPYKRTPSKISLKK